jgi:hypothetical protein
MSQLSVSCALREGGEASDAGNLGFESLEDELGSEGGKPSSLEDSKDVTWGMIVEYCSILVDCMVI